MKLTLAVALVLGLCCLSAPRPDVLAADDGTVACNWRQSGYGGGGRFTAAVVDPASEKTVYVGSDVAGFFRSLDGAESFSPLGRNLTGFAVADILPDPKGGRLFILTDDGLYVSRDRGDTQQKINPAIHYKSREPGSTLLVAAGDGSFFAATDTDGVFRFEPSDATWTVTPVGLSGVKVNSLALLGDTLHAATDQGVRRLSLGDFEEMDQGLPAAKRDITDITAQAGVLYCLEKERGVFARTDAGWEPRGPSPAKLPAMGHPYFKNMAANPAKPGSLFVASHPQYWPHLLVETANAGKDWRLVGSFTQTDGLNNWAKGLESIERIAFSPDGRLGILTDWWNVWRSLDGGTSWTQRHKGLQNTVVTDIKIHPADPKRLYLATADNGLMVSLDGGASWQRKMAGVKDGDAKAVALAPGRQGTVYLLAAPWEPGDTADTAYFHLYRSDDGGETWKLHRFKDRRRDLAVNYAEAGPCSLSVDSGNPDRVYVAVSGYGIYALDTTAAPSGSDAPAQNIATGIATPYFKGASALVAVPGLPGTLYTATQDGGVYKTQDGGANWQQLPGARGFVFALAVDPADPGHLLAAAAEKTVLETRDAGMSWNTILLPGERPDYIPASAVAFGPAGSGMIFVGTSAYDNKAADGLFVSRDGGKNFSKATMDLPRVGINALAASGEKPSDVLVGFNGLGLYTAGK